MSAVNASLPAIQASATQLQLEPHSDVAKKNAVFYRQQHGVAHKVFIAIDTVCEYWCTFIEMAVYTCAMNFIERVLHINICMYGIVFVSVCISGIMVNYSVSFCGIFAAKVTSKVYVHT